ncbi:hypothetical protein E3N88_34838 [Mikania micrantha]|uniref:ATP-dependent DNA helicase n=1 Tax=Mikania micrantha TaxID=192012 RepID=A0A5N6LZF2_9ASTR|nr:hypothetical protein E3N88_34838 [Mikania micrantha]
MVILTFGAKGKHSSIGSVRFISVTGTCLDSVVRSSSLGERAGGFDFLVAVSASVFGTTDVSIGKRVFLPTIPLCPFEDDMFPFKLKRKQFPIQLCFSITINKAQGQTISHVGVYLPNSVFSHGQLYVALSRGISRENTKVLVHPTKDFGRYVYLAGSSRMRVFPSFLKQLSSDSKFKFMNSQTKSAFNTPSKFKIIRGITTPAVKPTVLVIDGSENAPEVKFRVVRKRTCDSLLQSEVLGRKRRFGLAIGMHWVLIMDATLIGYGCVLHYIMFLDPYAATQQAYEVVYRIVIRAAMEGINGASSIIGVDLNANRFSLHEWLLMLVVRPIVATVVVSDGTRITLRIEKALAESGVAREDADYINAHATST